jgi:predicted transcriptional regulator
LVAHGSEHTGATQSNALISREDFYARQSEEYLQESFGGSLPAFLVAFGSRKKLSDREVEELVKIWEDGEFEMLYWSLFWKEPPTVEIPEKYL